MPPSKENDVLTVAPDVSSSPSTSNGPRPAETASRPQPVALEVPVTINGARTVEGSDKREPFSETTKTVLVFGHGAVIRLGSPVSPGQLLFLTNDKTKKEVVCQVVKSKNYRSISGYVELEFTEPVTGFWGMRFPSDRAVTPVPARPAVTPATGTPGALVSSAPKAATPPVSSAPKAPEISPLSVPPAANSVVQSLTAEPKIRLPHVAQSNTMPEAPATKGPEPSTAPVAGLSSSLATSLASLLGETESRTPTVPASVSRPFLAAPEKASTAGSKESEELKVQTTRLQEQLSSLLFNPAEKKPESNAPAGPGLNAEALLDVPTGVSEITKPDGAPAIPHLPGKTLVPAAKFGLDDEKVKIPAWLEPLARNAAAPASTQELIEREKAKHAAAAEVVSREQTSEEPLPITAVEPVASPASELPTIGNLLPLDEEVLREERPAKRSQKGLVFGAIAAALLAAAGGAWYFLQPANNNAQSTTAQLAVPAASQPRPAAPSLPAVPPTPTNGPSTTDSGAPIVAEPAKPNSLSPAGPSAKTNAPQLAPSVAVRPAPTKDQPPAVAAKENGRGSGSAIPAAEKELISRPIAQPEPKKPVIGEVHLASPTMSRRVTSQTDGDAAPTLTADGGNAGLDSAFSNAGNQPAAPEAPLAAGGNVTPAKLLSKVDAVYPAMAKSQHVSGDVVIDALIDAAGRVTTMKVISGPALLHQAAKDCLRQWKYQPATLDGHPVPMHLTLKLQFRMQ